MIMARNRKTVRPNILVVEGLWDDTSHALRAAGGEPTEESPWTLDDELNRLANGEYHGMVLTGGSDINPHLYDEKPCSAVYGIDNMRDWMEYRALKIALDLGIPVLGICRGAQIMNVFRGGSLVQDIDNHRSTEHTVYAHTDARVFKRAIGGREMECLSLHHQCMKDTGPDMRVAAYSPDGVPEAVESDDGLWLGVQFHPELTAFENGNAFAIFQWLVRTAAKYAGGTAPWSKYREARRQEMERIALKKAVPYSAQRLLPKTTETSWPARQAGDPAIPSMRRSPSMDDMTRVVQHSLSHFRTESELQVCVGCGMLFDDARDRLDHEVYVCGVHSGEEFFEGTATVIEPPAGDPAWETHAIDGYGVDETIEKEIH